MVKNSFFDNLHDLPGTEVSLEKSYILVKLKHKCLNECLEFIHGQGGRLIAFSFLEKISTTVLFIWFSFDSIGKTVCCEALYSSGEKLQTLEKFFPFSSFAEAEARELWGVEFIGNTWVDPAALSMEYRGKPSPMKKKR